MENTTPPYPPPRQFGLAQILDEIETSPQVQMLRLEARLNAQDRINQELRQTIHEQQRIIEGWEHSVLADSQHDDEMFLLALRPGRHDWFEQRETVPVVIDLTEVATMARGFQECLQLAGSRLEPTMAAFRSIGAQLEVELAPFRSAIHQIAEKVAPFQSAFKIVREG